jgi:hypothetical protein
MPGHIKLGKPGTPDEDPTMYLVSSGFSKILKLTDLQ